MREQVKVIYNREVNPETELTVPLLIQITFLMLIIGFMFSYTFAGLSRFNTSMSNSLTGARTVATDGR